MSIENAYSRVADAAPSPAPATSNGVVRTRHRLTLIPELISTLDSCTPRVVEMWHWAKTRGARHLGMGLSAMFACLCALSSARADAQPLLPRSQDRRPWADGVSQTAQALATELYVTGNEEFAELHFAQALALYKEAIQHWDHPAIRYNIAICLINLDQPMEALENLEKSLAYGPDPLEGGTYREGLTHRKLLDAQLAHVAIVSHEPGVEIALDGKVMFAGPGAAEQHVLAGKHHIVATKAGFLTSTATLVLDAGKRTTYEVAALERAPTIHFVRRWARWTPWAVIAGGAALGGLGELAYLSAQRNYAAYDRGVELQCPHGCDAGMLSRSPELTAALDRGHTEEVVAFTLLSVGGTVVFAGLLGVVFNEPRLQLNTAPVVTPVRGGATASLIGRF